VDFFAALAAGFKSGYVIKWGRFPFCETKTLALSEPIPSQEIRLH